MAETQKESQPAMVAASQVPVQAERAANQQRRSDRRGYYELADRMALAENELAIFRNFKNLNILSLLQLQAEILVLESDLEHIRDKDDNSDDAITIPFSNEEGDLSIDSVSYQRKLFSSCILEMQRVARDDPKKCTQYVKMVELRTKLREYNDLLLQFSNICKLKEPEEIELLSLKHWTLRRITDPSMPFMKKPESLVYRSYGLDDYVLIQKPNPEKDVIPPFVLHWYSRVYNWKTKKDLDVTSTRGFFLRKIEDGKTQDHFVKSRLIIVGNWLAPVLSSVVLVGSALILYSIQKTWNKLLAMIPITIVFSLIIKVFTSASRAEIFVAVAGFVAVEVVFVGNVA